MALNIVLSLREHQYKAAVENPISIGHPIVFDQESLLTVFNLPTAQEELLQRPSCKGAGYFCSKLEIIPHAHGTHIETARHLDSLAKPTLEIVMNKLLATPLLLAKRIGLSTSCAAKHELAIQTEHLWDPSSDLDQHIEAIVLCTGWLYDCKKSREQGTAMVDISSNGFPYLTPQLIRHLRNAYPRLRVLLVDLPSLDPKSDGKRLLAHREFLQTNQSWNENAIVEMCYLCRDTLSDPFYALSLNVANINSDAIPCNPVLFRLTDIVKAE